MSEEQPAATPPAKKTGCAAVVALVVVLGLVWAVAGSCNRSSDSAPSASGKYTQTWTKSYAETACSEWIGSMSEKQRFVASADMLSGARSKDGASGVPDDDLVNIFGRAITTACVIPTSTITDMAVGVYLTERTTFAP